MKRKIRVALLFGGQSQEHEVSVQSAKNIYAALDKNKYDITPIGIDKKGTWHLLENKKLIEAKTDFTPKVDTSLQVIEPIKLTSQKEPFDVVFPVLHGPQGEDGTVQGLLKLLNIPFVGAGVLGSAIGMDKNVQKRLLKEAGIKVAKFQVLTKRNAKITLPLPLFIKPANLGSSVGISKATTKKELSDGINLAFKYDKKILLEEEIKGREIEVSVLGNENPKASLPGEIITTHSFYDYQAKYTDENGAKLEIPAKLSQEKIHEFQHLAIKVFKVLCCEGMARVDFFLKPNGEILVNELNTIPGFTNSSMYPKLWEASGISVESLVDKLVNLALKSHRKS